MRAALNDVMEPDKVGTVWPQPDTRTVRQLETALLGLLLRDASRLACREIRSTLLWFTCQPLLFNSSSSLSLGGASGCAIGPSAAVGWSAPLKWSAF